MTAEEELELIKKVIYKALLFQQNLIYKNTPYSLGVIEILTELQKTIELKDYYKILKEEIQ